MTIAKITFIVSLSNLIEKEQMEAIAPNIAKHFVLISAARWLLRVRKSIPYYTKLTPAIKKHKVRKPGDQNLVYSCPT